MTITEEIKSLAAKINKALRKEKIPEYINEVNDSNIRELIYAIYNGHAFADKFMLAYLEAWQQLSYSDIQQIMKKLAEDAEGFLEIEPFLMFFYCYLKIDLLHLYAELDLKNKKLHQYLLNDFAQRPGRFYFPKNDLLRELKEFQLDPARLKAIRHRWITEGATKAEKINLTPARVSGGAVLYHVQCPVPQSWTWAQQLNNITVNP